MTQRRVQAYLEHGSAALRLERDKMLSGEQTEDMLLRAVAETQGDLLLYSTADPAQVRCYQRAGTQQVSLLLNKMVRGFPNRKPRTIYCLRQIKKDSV